MSSRLLRLLAGGGPGFGSRSVTVLFECRRCGTNLEAGTDRCPVCSSAEIARYELR